MNMNNDNDNWQPAELGAWVGLLAYSALVPVLCSLGVWKLVELVNLSWG